MVEQGGTVSFVDLGHCHRCEGNAKFIPTLVQGGTPNLLVIFYAASLKEMIAQMDREFRSKFRSRNLIFLHGCPICGQGVNNERINQLA